MRLFLIILPLGLLFAGCSDTERMDRLEAEIRAVKSDTRREVEGIRNSVAPGSADAGSGGGSLTERVGNLEQRVNQALEKYDNQSGKFAYLRQNANGHATMATDHGTFLIRLEQVDLNPRGQGFIAKISIANPGALTIQQFVLRGDFGAGVPTLAEGQEYSAYNRQIEAWQKTLTKFQFRITKPLRPLAWTTMDVILDATSRDDLELVRFSMDIENAHLDNVPIGGGSSLPIAGNAGEDNYAHISVGSKSASLLKTDYGAFLAIVKDASPSGDGTKLDLEIGNPYSFLVNECRIKGSFGAPLPRRASTEGQDEFINRLRNWMGQLQPFESTVSGKLRPGKWSSVSILVPGTVSDVKFLRAGLDVQYVTLPEK